MSKKNTKKQHKSKNQRAHPFDRIRAMLPQIILLLFVLQPLMDVLSYWQNALRIGNSLTLFLRLAVLAGTAALGFLLSKRKKLYCSMGLILILLAVLHGWACMYAGYEGWSDPISDLTNYIRFIQIPLFTVCLITFLRESEEQGYRAIEKGFVINLVIIFAVEGLSAVTHTNPYTYPNKEIGLLGWFYFANSQSAVLSALIPVVLMQLVRKKNLPLLIVGTVLSFGALYAFATRLAYLAIFVTAAGLVIVLLLCRLPMKRTVAVLLLSAAVCGAGIGVSPMTKNQLASHAVSVQKQMEFDEIVAETKEQLQTEDPEIYLIPAYEEYLGPMMDRFGAERVLQTYQYTENVKELKDWRRMKITYCSFLLEEASFGAKLFGMELGDMTWNGQVYDVENDLHGIFFLYGAVGLILLLVFLLYFAWLIVRALVKDFKIYMTLEAGAFGISLCMLMVHVYATAGVLRRPNASFYLSVALAVVYYLTMIRRSKSEAE